MFVTTRRLLSVLAVLIVAIALQTIMPSLSSAKPEFTMREGAACWQCHVNPSGGGVRTDLGFAHGQGLALEATTAYLDKHYPAFGEFTPTIGEHLQFGLDTWTMWHDRDEDPDIDGDEETNSSTFYLMEANFSVHAMLLPILSLVGAYDFALDTTETYGMIHNLPLGIYLKLGRFVPPYGLRLDDHTAFTRDPIGFHAISQDTGVEAGIRPGPFYLMGSLTNGNLGVNGQDRDGDYYAGTAQAGVRFWRINVGGSFFHNTRDDFIRQLYGPYLGVGIWKIVYLGEMAMIRQEGDDPDDPDDTTFTEGYAMTHLLDIELIKGLSLQGRYCFFEPDGDVDEDEFYQIAGGVNFFPMPYVETFLQYRYNAESEEEIDNDEIMFQGHFYF